MKNSNLFQQDQSAMASNRTRTSSQNKRTLFVMAAVAVGAFAFAPGMAMAAPWDSAASSVLAIFTGGMARTLAIIAVIALGIMGLAGKLSWDAAIKVIIGIVLIFGSAAIVDYVISAAA